MIEVLFGESEAGSMKAAKSDVIVGKTDGPVAVWMAGKKKPPEKENTGWIPGTAQEVICLGFMLDIGDIKEPADSKYRRELICSLYAQEEWETDPEMEAALKDAADVYVNERIRLENYLKDGEKIRIWYSDAPYSRCGFYSLCAMLQKHLAVSKCRNEICVVKMPEYSVQDDSITCWQNWGEVSAEEFAAFLPYERELTEDEIRMYTGLWNDLVEENSPLRTLINGQIIGVPETFYDFLIWKKLTKEPVKEARLIGDILGNYRLSVGDWWYAKRIDCFISQGKIEVVWDSKTKYARMIRAAEQKEVCNEDRVESADRRK